MGQMGGGCFAVGSGNPYQLGLGMSGGKFDFIHHGQALFQGCLNPRQFGSNARAFDHQIRVPGGDVFGTRGRVRNVQGFQLVHALFTNGALIPHLNLHTQNLAQTGGATTAFTGSQHKQAFPFHRSLSMVKVRITKRIVTIQKRVTNLGSARPPNS